MKYYLGIDIGGTNIKGVCANANGNILAEDSVPTGSKLGGDNICKNAAKLARLLVRRVGVPVEGCGVGCAGMIGADGGVVFAGNLGLKKYPLEAKLAELLNLPVRVGNDANVAALGEATFGAGKAFKDSVFITLGTGVGGGIVADGRLFEGGKRVGAEIGHMVIVRGGNPCTCGRRGCFEAYASATALIEETKKAMEENRQSAMWQTYDLKSVSGKTAFEYADADPSAKGVVDRYIGYLACGIVNLVNIFRPQAIILGGGVAEQGERLIAPLQKIVAKEIFGGQKYAPVKIVKASLGNLAGALGAVALMTRGA